MRWTLPLVLIFWNTLKTTATKITVRAVKIQDSIRKFLSCSTWWLYSWKWRIICIKVVASSTYTKKQRKKNMTIIKRGYQINSQIEESQTRLNYKKLLRRKLSHISAFILKFKNAYWRLKSPMTKEKINLSISPSTQSSKVWLIICEII